MSLTNYEGYKEKMGEQISVMVFGGSPGINRCLQSDLRVLGFRPLLGRYPNVDPEDITKAPPDVILLELTVCDCETLSVCELLLRDEILPPQTALVALVSEDTMGQIPIEYRFADVIKYPYDIAELSFRLRRVVHHNQESARDTIRIGNMSISPSRYEVRVDGQPVALSHKEYELVKYLVINPNRVFTREALLSSIWGYPHASGSRTVDVHIRRLRAKIGDTGHAYIKTVRGGRLRPELRRQLEVTPAAL